MSARSPFGDRSSFYEANQTHVLYTSIFTTKAIRKLNFLRQNVLKWRLHNPVCVRKAALVKDLVFPSSAMLSLKTTITTTLLSRFKTETKICRR